MALEEVPTASSDLGMGRISPEQDKLDLMRSHSSCSYLCLYYALLGLPDLS